MKVNKSQSDHCTTFFCNEMERSGSTPDFLYQAFENADGVPFQLIFGLHIGDGHYLHIGSGFTGLPGIAPEDFTELISPAILPRRAGNSSIAIIKIP